MPPASAGTFPAAADAPGPTTKPAGDSPGRLPVGLFYQMWETLDVSTAALLARAHEEFAFIAGLGYASVWIGEHHLNPPGRDFHGRVPVPELLVVDVCARVPGLRVGTGVKVLPMTDAQRAAEEIGLTDLLTGGRADFGIGQGTGAPTEEDRLRRQRAYRERLDDILRFLRGDTSTGLPLLNVAPRPGAVGRLWAACRDDASVEHAAANGLNYVVGQAENARSQANHIRRYREAGGTGTVRGVRAVYVAETRERALAEFDEAFRMYASVFSSTEKSGSRYLQDAIAAGYLPAVARTVEERLAHANLIVGGPRDVAAGLLEYAEITGVDRLDLMVQFPRLSPERTRRTLELFTSEVWPLLAPVLG